MLAALLVPVSSASAQSAPAAPAVSATGGHRCVYLTASVSGDTASTITDWQINLNKDGNGFIGWRPLDEIGLTDLDPARGNLKVIIGGLTNGRTSTLNVRAVNSAGNGNITRNTTATPTTTRPGKPTVRVTAGNRKLYITAVVDVDVNGAGVTADDVVAGKCPSPINGWRLNTSGGGVGFGESHIQDTDHVANTLTYVWRDRYNGAEESIRIRATSSEPGVSWGVLSDTVRATPQTTAPENAFLPQASVSNYAVILTGYVSSNGGEAITGWEVRKRYVGPGGGNEDWETLTTTNTDTRADYLRTTYTDVQKGATYTFEIRGVNSRGSGVASRAVSVTIPTSSPGKPTLTATAGDESVTLDGRIHDDGGAKITGWQYSTTSATGPWTALTDTNAGGRFFTGTVSGLTNGTAYTFWVRALNGVGSGGTASDSVTATPVGPPGKPSAAARAGVQSAVLTASVTDNGGSAITGWKVRYKTGGDYNSWAEVSSDSDSRDDYLATTVTGLTAGTAHTFEVRAVNAQGDGDVSDEVTATPTGSAAPRPTRASTTPTTPTDRFTDDDGIRHEDEINLIAARGITRGCNPEGTLFCPQRRLTRAEMAAFLQRMLDLPVPADPTVGAFTDIAGHYHRDSIRAIAAAGITLGCNPEGTLFCPDRRVTRGEMSSFLARAFKLPVPTDPTVGSFTDIAGSVHRDNIRAVVSAGLAGACDASGLLFCPDRIATRAEMANTLAQSLRRDFVTVGP